MTFGKRKREKTKRTVATNLTYCRLLGDLYAVEASIRDNAPKTPNDEGGTIRRFINKIINDVNNAVRRYNTTSLTVDREKARRALDEFRAEHSGNELKMSENADEFGAYITKKLFKKDKDGLERMAYALMFAIDERNREYQCPEESLEVVSEILFNDPKTLGRLYSSYKSNYMSISAGASEFEKGLGLGMGLGGAIALSLLPVGITGAISLFEHLRRRRCANAAFSRMQENEANASLAFYLTMIEASHTLSDAKRKAMIDELLERVTNLRADAEYKMYVEGENAPDCRSKIRLCELTLKRLGVIIGV